MAIDSQGKSSFPRGVHPPESKHLTEDKAIVPGPAVKELAILLSQHIGAPSQAVVAKGDAVEAGQVLGECQAFVCAPVHAPIAGKVKEVALQPHPVLGRSPAVTIAAEQEIEPALPAFTLPADFDPANFSPDQICDAVRDAGLVGMGGAGFPTSVKLSPEAKPPKHTLLVNACECEPYITCDNRLMLEWTDQVIAGIRLAQRACGAAKVYIGIEDNKPQAIETMTAAVAKLGLAPSMTVTPLETKYPQGGERQLINAVLKTNVPTGGIPPQIGVVVINVATAAALADAVIHNRPLTHRVVTVTGEAIAKPGNYYVAIGTPVQTLIDFCGGVTTKGAKVVMGGPMMGLAIADLSTPITKTSGAITVLTKTQIGRAKFERRETACIRCGRCLEVCPENLNPTKIAHAVKSNLLDLAEKYYIGACI